MRRIIIFSLFFLLANHANLFCQTDSIYISESIRINRSDAKDWVKRFQNDIDKYVDENRQMNDLSCDALFIGSSSINLWNSIYEDLAPMKIIRRSYGGATIRDMLYNYDVIARGYKPNCIVIYVENDLCSCKEDISEYETFDLFRVFIQRIQRDYPGIPFYIISFKPSFARQNMIEQQKTVNHLLKTFAENTDNVEFIDITKIMYDKQGNLRKDIFLKDNLHLNAKGYELWTSIIKPVIIKHRGKNPSFG